MRPRFEFITGFEILLLILAVGELENVEFDLVGEFAKVLFDLRIGEFDEAKFEPTVGRIFLLKMLITFGSLDMETSSSESVSKLSTSGSDSESDSVKSRKGSQ